VEKFGIRHDVDFQLEILQLLGRLYKADAEEAARLRKLILDSVTGDAELLSKAKLIEKFIEDPPPLGSEAEIRDSFEAFWEKERVAIFDPLSPRKISMPTS
jgi:hypothetical protein